MEHHLLITRVHGQPDTIAVYAACPYGIAHIPHGDLLMCYPNGGQDEDAVHEDLKGCKTEKDADIFRCSIAAAHRAVLVARCKRLLAPFGLALLGRKYEYYRATVINLLRSDPIIACNPEVLSNTVLDNMEVCSTSLQGNAA